MKKSSILRDSFLTLGLILSLNTNILTASEGKALFQTKCASCHTMTRPQDMSNMLAPPVKGLMFHMDEHFKNKEEIVQHINSFVMNPTQEQAICRSVRRFGLMPSQKGLLSAEELNTIAEWMVQISSKSCEPKPSR